MSSSTKRSRQLSASSFLLIVCLNARRCQSFHPAGSGRVPFGLLVRPPLVGVVAAQQQRPNIGRIILGSVVDKDEKENMSFDQAGAGIMDEDDQKKLEDMKGFVDDGNPDGGATNYEALRAALRSRTDNLGLEKSQVTADYVARRTAEAQQAGSAAAANESNDFFAGLDLSKIRQAQTIDPNAPPPVDENLPSMFYEVDELLSDEDKAIADPASQLPILEQALGELKATKWPTPWAALREVGVVIIMIALTGYMVLAWDNGLRWLYTDILHFIPSPDELAEYTNRFDGLDLPPGWTDNMDEGDISKFTDAVLSAPSEN